MIFMFRYVCMSFSGFLFCFCKWQPWIFNFQKDFFLKKFNFVNGLYVQICLLQHLRVPILLIWMATLKFYFSKIIFSWRQTTLSMIFMFKYASFSISGFPFCLYDWQPWNFIFQNMFFHDAEQLCQWSSCLNIPLYMSLGLNFPPHLRGATGCFKTCLLRRR